MISTRVMPRVTSTSARAREYVFNSVCMVRIVLVRLHGAAQRRSSSSSVTDKTMLRVQRRKASPAQDVRRLAYNFYGNAPLEAQGRRESEWKIKPAWLTGGAGCWGAWLWSGPRGGSEHGGGWPGGTRRYPRGRPLLPATRCPGRSPPGRFWWYT